MSNFVVSDAEESWKTVVDANGYLVSNFGRVWVKEKESYRIKRGNPVLYKVKGRMLKPGLAKMGYFIVSINNRSRYVHEIVLSTFVGKRPNKFQARHKNGVRTDN